MKSHFWTVSRRLAQPDSWHSSTCSPSWTSREWWLKNCARTIWKMFFSKAEDGIRDYKVTGVQACALPIWPEWPKVHRLDYGQEEAAARFGADPRVYLTTVKKFGADAGARVKDLVTVQVERERNGQGQFVPRELPGTEGVRP